MNRNVFINCPFDEEYLELFDALLFAIYLCDCAPRCALEIDNSAQIRLNKIYSIIEECDLGVHDISRTELNANQLPRFNMPFEFGLFMGAKRFGDASQQDKNCVVFDQAPFRYVEFISDIAGQDIKSHDNKPEEVIRNIRNWLNTFSDLSPLPGAQAIIEQFEQYCRDRQDILDSLSLTPADVQYADRILIIERWLSIDPLESTD
ncbi:MAG: hypothetical protein AAFQ98_19515 [Bacteroidota bacterium]